ncbi:hypothetical protein M9435_002233 [Picochlorum sp. BPE23]|nr:hypothetical protein M9435_002233 [Picochlorum sp. BPE23]
MLCVKVPAFLLLAIVGLGRAADPGTLVAPGIVEVELKNGTLHNVTCPPVETTTLKGALSTDDYMVMAESCIGANFDTVKGCDACLASYAKTVASKAFSAMAKDTSLGAPPDPVPFQEIDFSNGCPYAQACRDAIVDRVDEETKLTEDPSDDPLGAALGEMIDKCKGPNPGKDYDQGYDELLNLVKVLNGQAPSVAPTPSTESSPSPSPSSDGEPLFTMVSGALMAVMVAVIA